MPRSVSAAALLVPGVILALGAAAPGCSTDEKGLAAGAATPATVGPAGRAPGSPAPAPAPAPARAAAPRPPIGPDATAALPAPPATHAVFSLGDNRLLAHVARGEGLVLLAGSGGFAKYVELGHPRLRWALRQTVDGRRVARPDRRAAVAFPLAPAQATAGAVTLRVHAPAPGRLAARLNGAPPHRADLAAGWTTVTVPVPAGALRPGENRLELDAPRGLGVEWIQIGGPVRDAPPALWDGATGALRIAGGDGLSYYVQVPAGGRLEGEVEGANCAVRVTATAHGRPAADPLGSLGAGAAAALDLSPLAGQVVRLELTAVAAGDGGPCLEARVRGAALTVPGPAPRVTRGRPPRHIVLWIMDTLRADRIRLFNPAARALTPGLDALAETGAVFRHAYVQGNASSPSHASIFSSAYPVNHRVVIVGSGWSWRIEDSLVTLGEALAPTGMYLAGVTANGLVERQGGYGLGFHRFHNLMRDKEFGGTDRINAAVPGEHLLRVAREALAGHVADPFLLFLGTIDTHVPWVAREPWISQYDPRPYRGRFERQATGGGIGVRAGHMLSWTVPSPRDLERILALYDCGISYQDQLVGAFRAWLAAQGIADDTMIVITADHGEDLWETGHAGHGGSVREALVQVPFLVHYPPLFPGVAVDEGVETIDILPTILDALGLPIPETAQGESLIPLAQGVGRGYPRPSTSTMHEVAHAMRLGAWKGVIDRGGRFRLYDLEAEPAELTALEDRRPIERRFVTDPMSIFLVHRRAWRKLRWGVPSNMTARAALDLGGE